MQAIERGYSAAASETGSSEIELLGTGHADYLEEALQEGGRIQVPGDPISGSAFDEKIVQSFRRLLGESAMEVAVEYDGKSGNDTGMDDLLEKFIDRNEDAMSRAQLQNLQAYYYSANLLAQAALGERDRNKALTLKRLLRDKIYPLQRIVSHKYNQQYAEAKTDVVPADLTAADHGDAHKVGATAAKLTNDRRNAVRWQVSQELRRSTEYAKLVKAQQLHSEMVRPGLSSELAIARANLIFLRKQQQSWARYNAANENLFENEIVQLARSHDVAQKELIQNNNSTELVTHLLFHTAWAVVRFWNRKKNADAVKVSTLGRSTGRKSMRLRNGKSGHRDRDRGRKRCCA